MEYSNLVDDICGKLDFIRDELNKPEVRAMLKHNETFYVESCMQFIIYGPGHYMPEKTGPFESVLWEIIALIGKITRLNVDIGLKIISKKCDEIAMLCAKYETETVDFKTLLSPETMARLSKTTTIP